MTDLRRELPRPLPDRIAKLPIDGRGYPVPVFVQWFHADVQRTWCEPGQGIPDFRIVDSRVMERCIHLDRCWICGDELGRYRSFVAGPMCAVNRTSAEPPQHHDCATWSAKACPFLARPHARRREANLPVPKGNVAGRMIERNPGVTIVWTTLKPRMFNVPTAMVDGGAGSGALWHMGQPDHVEWWREGRTATRQEVMDSIDSGLPTLEEAARSQRGGLEVLEGQLRRCYRLLPFADV